MKRCRKIAALLVAVCLLIAVGVWLFQHVWGARDAKRSVGAPLLVCEEPLKDIGDTQVLQQKHTFTLMNPSSERVRISDIGHSCNCLKVHVAKAVLEPGESTNVDVEMEVRPKAAGAITHFSSDMWVYVNGEDAATLALRIQGVFIPVVYFPREQITIKAPFNMGDPFSQDVDVFVNREKGVDITGVSTSGPLGLHVAIKERGKARRGPFEKVVVEVNGKLTRGVRLPESTLLVVSTNSKDWPELKLPIVLVKDTTEEVQLTPGKLAFGVLEPGQRKSLTATVVWPRDSGYAVKKAYVSGKGIDVHVGEARASADKVSLPITCQLDAGIRSGAIVEDLIVQLAAHDHTEMYKLPVTGFVKAAVAAAAK